MSRFPKAAVAGLLLIPLVAGAFVIQERSALSGARLFDQVLSIVADRYVDSVDVGALYEKAARGLIAQLKDPYAELYTPKQVEMFNQNTGGFYAGIGMQIEDLQGNITVQKVFPHTPAAEAGILTGDQIVYVDTFSVRGHAWKTDSVSAHLKGPPGTKVSAKFVRAGVAEPFTVPFVRRVVHIPAVDFAIMLDNKTAYIPVQQFSDSAAAQVAVALKRLTAEGARSVILDLRGNGGGFLPEALDMTNLFIPKGKEIVSVRGRGEPPETAMTDKPALAPTLPMVVLTDGYTASASEIVAGALQDHDRALILGTTSFGKGLVQQLFDLDGGYKVKLTTAKWYTPSGRSIQKERVLTDDGQLVEVHPDSLETDSARKARPKFRSDGGRVVYGGGAITPDIYVPYDTLTTPEQKLARELNAKGGLQAALALESYALGMKTKVKPDFVVTQQMRDDFYQLLTKRGVAVDRKDYDAGMHYIDRTLDSKISEYAFGDSTAKRREVPDDVQLVRALDILKKGTTTKELLALAADMPGGVAGKPREKK
jgi:carboxyl-terminal processing protease